MDRCKTRGSTHGVGPGGCGKHAALTAHARSSGGGGLRGWLKIKASVTPERPERPLCSLLISHERERVKI